MTKYERFVRDQIGDVWFEEIGHLFIDDRMRTAIKLLRSERSKRNVYPPAEDVFAAFRLTPINEIKVVILGQDPYYNEGQAHGLAFSIKDPFMPLPPSLKNIFIEAEKSTGLNINESGNLTRWAEQGVFLLNRYLTVVEKRPGSHASIWDWFTKEVIKTINDRFHPTIFLL